MLAVIAARSDQGSIVVTHYGELSLYWVLVETLGSVIEVAANLRAWKSAYLQSGCVLREQTFNRDI
ncbi:hypothetical protein ACTXGQ_18445 [Marinobacter sp. 1Y8]